MTPGARDLALQRNNARFQFGDRQRIEVLPQQQAECVTGTRRGVVHVHEALTLTPAGAMSIR